MVPAADPDREAMTNVLPRPRSARWLPSLLLGVALAGFGLLTPLPAFLGPALGGGGALGSWLLAASPRASEQEGRAAPALAALAVLAVFAPPVPSSELFGGAVALALVAWVAGGSPRRAPGGVARAGLPLLMMASALAGAWGIALLLPGTPEVGVAGGLVALALFLLAWLLYRPFGAGAWSAATA